MVYLSGFHLHLRTAGGAGRRRSTRCIKPFFEIIINEIIINEIIINEIIINEIIINEIIINEIIIYIFNSLLSSKKNNYLYI